MTFVVDVHLHSHYSRATSKNLNLEHLSKWAQLKGVHVVGTGDITHPGWLAEMKTKLSPAEEGLFSLKEEYTSAVRREVFKACQGTVRFMLAGEISNIYKKNDKVRKIHHLVFFPSFEAVEKFQARLEKIGNIRSDGRPILGLDSRDLLEIVLETDPQGYLIPAHIWTPWFALLGSMSGFDSVEECFDDLTPHIFALETGLSSDPPMNWRLSALDRYTLVSNSDAHSPQKLAREANLFNTELSYPAMFAALKTGDPAAFGGTIEFFPEEGKYHYDGHRKCSIRWDPKETIKNKGLCEVCGKPVTVGVMHRVEELADRERDFRPTSRHPYKSLIPLPEILAEMYGIGVAAKRVTETYETLLEKLGPELNILMHIPLDDIARVGGALLAEALRRMRAGEIEIAAGYDGEYGIIRVFSEDERVHFSSQLAFFEAQPTPANNAREEINRVKDAAPRYEIKPQSGVFVKNQPRPTSKTEGAPNEHPLLRDLNPQQRQAVQSVNPVILIVAGPGTGKTNTLTRRIAYLVEQKRAAAENILAVTFTNKAAEEMQQRLNHWLGAAAAKTTIKTFHALGAMILKEDGHRIGLQPNFTILNEKGIARFLKEIVTKTNEKDAPHYLNWLSKAKIELLAPENVSSHPDFKEVPQLGEIYSTYQLELRKNQAVDFDDLIYYPVQILEQFPEVLATYRWRFVWIFVDEYQDVNFAQYRLLRLLATSETRLCVIGDPDQAIYGFRGARREFFLSFQKDFPAAEIINLNKNYRSPQFILDAARQMIAGSGDSQTERLLSEIITEDKLEIYCAPTDKAEAEYVVHEIEKMVGGTSYFSLDSGRVDVSAPIATKSFADFAVLYRLNQQSRLLEEAFRRSGIPYQIIGDTPFFERDEIQSVLSYLCFLHNPHWDLNKKLHVLKEFAPGKSVAEIIEHVLDNFLNKDQINEKREWFDRLILKSKPFGDNLDEFLQVAALSSDTDEYDPRSDRVALMTLHAAKGLEFPVVFIVGCEENLIPYLKSGAQTELDEERRLLYVGMTRAKQRLKLVHSKSRFLFGQTMQNAPSRFLSDIEARLKEIRKMAAVPKKRVDEASPQLSLF